LILTANDNTLKILEWSCLNSHGISGFEFGLREDRLTGLYRSVDSRDVFHKLNMIGNLQRLANRTSCDGIVTGFLIPKKKNVVAEQGNERRSGSTLRTAVTLLNDRCIEGNLSLDQTSHELLLATRKRLHGPPTPTSLSNERIQGLEKIFRENVLLFL